MAPLRGPRWTRHRQLGSVGRVEIRGRSIIDHYAGDQHPDRFSPDGWLRTGDLGFLDSDGYLTLVGRTDDVINRSGEKVYPSEIEDAMLADPDVLKAAVVAMRDEVLGQVPAGYVVLREAVEGSDPAPARRALERIEARLAATLVRAKRPVVLHAVASLPQGPTGKVLRRAVPQHCSKTAVQCGAVAAMSQTIDVVAPIGAEVAAPAAAVAESPAAKVGAPAEPRRGTRKRLDHIDAMRPIKQAGVVSTHTLLAFAPAASLATGASLQLLHVTREAFLFRVRVHAHLQLPRARERTVRDRCACALWVAALRRGRGPVPVLDSDLLLRHPAQRLVGRRRRPRASPLLDRNGVLPALLPDRDHGVLPDLPPPAAALGTPAGSSRAADPDQRRPAGGHRLSHALERAARRGCGGSGPPARSPPISSI